MPHDKRDDFTGPPDPFFGHREGQPEMGREMAYSRIQFDDGEVAEIYAPTDADEADLDLAVSLAEEDEVELGTMDHIWGFLENVAMMVSQSRMPEGAIGIAGAGSAALDDAQAGVDAIEYLREFQYEPKSDAAKRQLPGPRFGYGPRKRQ